MIRSIIESDIEHQSPLLENGAQVYGITSGYIIESEYHRSFQYKEITLIGEFSIDYSEEDIISEDRKIADLIKDGKKKTLNYQIYVYGNEGPIPHFHLIEKAEDNRSKKVDSCICIYEAKYFDHGSHMSTLNQKELKVLDHFLRANYNDISTYWEFIATSFDASNPDNYTRYKHLRITNTQPDYTKTTGFRSNTI